LPTTKLLKEKQSMINDFNVFLELKFIAVHYNELFFIAKAFLQDGMWVYWPLVWATLY
jgi:hypothetical protein